MLLIFLNLFGCQRHFEPPKEAPIRNPGASWRILLDDITDDDGMVNYALLETRRDTLDSYVAWISEHGPFSDEIMTRYEEKRVAFYLNAYNALVMYAVIENIPIQSVSDVDVGIYTQPNVGFFFGQRFKVDGEWMSLYHLEMERLLGNYHNPLIHAGLNCASKGCPPPHYYTHFKLNETLKEHMQEFLNSSRGSRQTDSGWELSELFVWYEKDFTRWSQANTLCEFLSEYAEEPLSNWLQSQEPSCEIPTFAYDWSLNESIP